VEGMQSEKAQHR